MPAITFKCSHCGAPLKVAPDQPMVTCDYCHTVTRIAATRQHRRAEPRSSSALQVWIVGLIIMGVVSAAAIAMAVLWRSQASDQIAQPTPIAPVAAVPPTPVPAITPTEAPRVAVPTSPVAPARPKPPREPAPTGPISSKKEAEEILRPELLACMKEHGVHYLITRLGNNMRGGTVPALGLVETSVVDYKRTPGFATTPLGRCIARAARGVRAPAYGGNSIYFGLRNESIPDPLADSPAHLDAEAAKQALSARDDEARDCATRSPSGSRPGESQSVMVYFEGATGKVSRVEPYYVDIRSAYGRCLTSVYRKASVGKFREIEQYVVIALAP